MKISDKPIRYRDAQAIPIHQVIGDDGKVLYEGPMANCKLYKMGLNEPYS